MIFWIASYPKSGNTWLRALISSYYYTEDGAYNQKIIKKIGQFPEKRHFESFEYDKNILTGTTKYWLNNSDEDAKNYIKIFTFLNKEIIEELILEHESNPNLRILQKRLASEITQTVHTSKELNNAIKASGILFSKEFRKEIEEINENLFLDIFEGGPIHEISFNQIKDGINIIKLLSEITGFLPSNSEARRALKENSISVNKNKVNETFIIGNSDLINNKYIVLNRGKKKTFIIKVG